MTVRIDRPRGFIAALRRNWWRSFCALPPTRRAGMTADQSLAHDLGRVAASADDRCALQWLAIAADLAQRETNAVYGVRLQRVIEGANAALADHRAVALQAYRDERGRYTRRPPSE